MPTSPGFLALRLHGPEGTEHGYSLHFVSGLHKSITRLDTSTGMFATIDDSLLESSVAEKTFTDIAPGGVVNLKEGDVWDSDFVVWFSMTMTSEDGIELRTSFSLPKGADALPTEEVAVLGGPAVVFLADWKPLDPLTEQERPPREGTLHLLPGDATDEEIEALVRAIRGEEEGVDD